MDWGQTCSSMFPSLSLDNKFCLRCLGSFLLVMSLQDHCFMLRDPRRSDLIAWSCWRVDILSTCSPLPYTFAVCVCIIMHLAALWAAYICQANVKFTKWQQKLRVFWHPAYWSHFRANCKKCCSQLKEVWNQVARARKGGENHFLKKTAVKLMLHLSASDFVSVKSTNLQIVSLLSSLTSSMLNNL